MESLLILQTHILLEETYPVSTSINLFVKKLSIFMYNYYFYI